eukprot:COSAG04_NODE_3877_length_2455_cov_1.409593_3_plen_103_part_00
MGAAAAVSIGADGDVAEGVIRLRARRNLSAACLMKSTDGLEGVRLGRGVGPEQEGVQPDGVEHVGAKRLTEVDATEVLDDLHHHPVCRTAMVRPPASQLSEA